MKKLRLKLQDIVGSEILTREQLKTVVGGSRDGGGGSGTQRYQCSCNGQTGTWQYTSGNTPSQSTLNQDIANYCNNGAQCGWVTCGNPGVQC